MIDRWITDHLDWADQEKRPGLVSRFKEELSKHRKAYLEEKQREIAVKKEFVFGVNWAGIDLFAKLAGLKGCEMPMVWVVENVVKPICEAEQCQLVELFFGVTANKSHCVGKANWFHSYAWGERFQDTLASIGTNLYKPKSTTSNYFWW